MHNITFEKAKRYDTYRLPYASEAVNDLCKHVGDHDIVADIGAGTGQLAKLFADTSKQIYLVEPDPAMRKVASLSLANITTIEICDGSAEQTTLAENSIDLIVIGNAFHRFKPEACDELRRILKKKGWIALFSYNFKNPTFTEMLSAKLSTLKEMTGRMAKTWPRTPVEDLFGQCPTHKRCYPQSYAEDWEQFFGAARAGIEAPEMEDQEFSTFEALNREIFNTFAVDEKIIIEYETQVLFGQPFCC